MSSIFNGQPAGGILLPASKQGENQLRNEPWRQGLVSCMCPCFVLCILCPLISAWFGCFGPQNPFPSPFLHLPLHFGFSSFYCCLFLFFWSLLFFPNEAMNELVYSLTVKTSSWYMVLLAWWRKGGPYHHLRASQRFPLLMIQTSGSLFSNTQ